MQAEPFPPRQECDLKQRSNILLITGIGIMKQSKLIDNYNPIKQRSLALYLKKTIGQRRIAPADRLAP